MNIVTMPIGTKAILKCKQFCSVNKIVKVRDDQTGLNRDIAYFKYVDRPRHQEFAIWQFEIDKGGLILTPLFEQSPVR